MTETDFRGTILREVDLRDTDLTLSKLKAGADITIRNNSGYTALMLTSIFVYEGGEEVASQLLKARAETKGIKNKIRNKIAIIWDKIILARDFVKDQF